MTKRVGGGRRTAPRTTVVPAPPTGAEEVPPAAAEGAGGQNVVPFERIPYENLTDQVYRAVKHRILSNQFEVGSRLRDEELAAQLGVSRTPVREAILRLNREGLVDVFPRSGTQVRRFTERDIDEIFELRTALETLAIRKAVPRLSPAMLTRLKEMSEHAEAAMNVGDPKPALDFDAEMHRAVLQACDNHRLQQSMATINDFVVLFRNIGAGTPFHRGFTYRHREIVSALERRDPELAARMLAEHIDAAKAEVFRDFRQRKLLDPVPDRAGARRRRRAAAASPSGNKPA